MTLIALMAFLILVASWAILPSTDIESIESVEIERLELTGREVSA
jgi:hypothetical protein